MKWLYGIILVALVGIGVCGGVWYEQKTVVIKPYYQGQIQTVELAPEVVEKQVFAYVDRDRIVYSKLSDWGSEEELLAFLEADQTDEAVFYDLRTGGLYRGACEQYALMLRDNAETIGKWLSFEKVTSSEYTALTGRAWVGSLSDAHAMNHAIVKVGSKRFYYYVEPQTDQIWKSTELD